MQNKRDFVFIVILIGLVVLNLYNLASLRKTEEEITDLENSLSSLRVKLSSEVSGIRNSINNMREEQKWYTPPRLDIVQSGQKENKIKLSWQVKNYLSDSEIVFYYQLPGQDEYISAVPREEKPGHFSVIITVKSEIEPKIDVVFKSNSDQKYDKPIAFQGSEKSKNKELLLKYYISRHNKLQTESSKIGYMGLDKIRYNLFKPLKLTIYQNDNNFRFNLLINSFYKNMTRYKLRKVYLQKRENGVVKKEWQLKKQKIREEEEKNTKSPEIYAKEINTITKSEKLYLVIYYSENVVVEKEINII